MDIAATGHKRCTADCVAPYEGLEVFTTHQWSRKGYRNIVVSQAAMDARKY